MNSNDFLNIITPFIESKVTPAFSLGKIDPSHTAGSNPRILFDGETSVSSKRYKYLSSYTPKANDRVLIANVSGTHVVLGKIS
ncbi:hypothetical protein 019DV002_30 [Bacillus phage 019DV002]|uniref:Uncharacterized protein n=1 Tax=Bacillus phage 019DV002 TaxID=2601653 RepID=A0A5J6T649_9CAUD|nr:hypothetical protein 019DV002_30 [Bacillus phage 019DV002]QFG05258.1 hypothetical protein 019DV004_30 [Bacillus phage 019DV004]